MVVREKRFFVLIKSLAEHACSANVFILKVGRSQNDHFSRSGLARAAGAETSRAGNDSGVAGRPHLLYCSRFFVKFQLVILDASKQGFVN